MRARQRWRVSPTAQWGMPSAAFDLHTELGTSQADHIAARLRVPDAHR